MRSTATLAIVLVVAAAPAFAQGTSDGGFTIRALSTRPDMVSGGDVLIQVDVPPSASGSVAITVNGRAANVESRSAAATTRVVRLTGLQTGSNVIEVGVTGQRPAARLVVVNHPIAGPVMSGPRQTPFFCETEALGLGRALDADCSAATKVDYFYRSRQDPQSPFKPYDVKGPRPADLETTTTLDGKTVPYIVRREMGTINRAIYGIAFLHEPGTPLPDPWNSTASSWNGRLIYSFGAGCQAGYHQGRVVGGGFVQETQLGDYGVAKGYAVASSSLNSFGTSCNDVTSAETMMMVKEYFIERFGVPRYTIGSGRSGGSMQQQLIANNYPGLLDGVIPTASVIDTITFMNNVFDCELLERAFDTSSLAWSHEQKTAVSGEANWEYCARNGTSFLWLRPTNCDTTAIPAAEIYDAKTNPKGVRCTWHDNLVNVFGRDPKTGFARRPFDNLGIQYGLRPLNEGRITIDQFIDLNRRIGGHDMDGRVGASRAVADPEALRIAYQSGRVNDASRGLATVPIIDARPYTDGTGDVHDALSSHISRARLVAANGTSGNQVLHTYAPGTDIQRVQRDNLDEMEQWLAAIAKDTAPARTPLEKVIRNRPPSVTDACYTAGGEKIADMRRCAQMFPVYATPRLVAGMPLNSTMLKCELRPVDRRDYPAATDAQLAAIRAMFPSGVCDYQKPGVSVRAPDVWVSYGDGN